MELTEQAMKPPHEGTRRFAFMELSSATAMMGYTIRDYACFLYNTASPTKGQLNAAGRMLRTKFPELTTKRIKGGDGEPANSIILLKEEKDNNTVKHNVSSQPSVAADVKNLIAALEFMVADYERLQTELTNVRKALASMTAQARKAVMTYGD